MVAEASEISFASEVLYVLNQFKAVPSGPNQFSSLSRGILCQMLQLRQEVPE